MSRLQGIVDNFVGTENPDDTMQEIISVLTNTEIVPEPGKFYTFIYQAKTPNIEYDEFPLIACTGVSRTGFTGFNFHWQLPRQYTWEEVIGQMHEVYPDELEDARSLSYAKFKISA